MRGANPTVRATPFLLREWRQRNDEAAPKLLPEKPTKGNHSDETKNPQESFRCRDVIRFSLRRKCPGPGTRQNCRRRARWDCGQEFRHSQLQRHSVRRAARRRVSLEAPATSEKLAGRAQG